MSFSQADGILSLEVLPETVDTHQVLGDGEEQGREFMFLTNAIGRRALQEPLADRAVLL